MRTQWFWSASRFVRDVAIMMAVALAFVAGLSLSQAHWTMAFIQGTLYAGSVLFVAGMVLLGLQLLTASAWQRIGAPNPWQRWYAWWSHVMAAGLLVFFLGLWLQGAILGEWVDFPPPPF